MRFWLVGGQVDWMRKTSRPRMFSLILTMVSPSGKELTVASPRGTLRYLQMARASSGLALPVKILSSFLKTAIGVRVGDGRDCLVWEGQRQEDWKACGGIKGGHRAGEGPAALILMWRGGA